MTPLTSTEEHQRQLKTCLRLLNSIPRQSLLIRNIVSYSSNIAALEAALGVSGPVEKTEKKYASTVGCVVTDGEAGVGRATSKRRDSPLLSLPYEIRRMIYQHFFDEKRTIHLTHGPTRQWYLLNQFPAKYHISRAGVHLQLACKEISEEIADLVYKHNDFVFGPGQFDYNTTRWPDGHCSISDLWMDVMRPSILERVKSLEVLLPLSPTKENIANLPQWLAIFSKIKIAVQGRKIYLNGNSSILWHHQIGVLCQSIAVARSNRGITIWDDKGDPAMTRLFQVTLPTGFLVASRPTSQELESKTAEVDVLRICTM